MLTAMVVDSESTTIMGVDDNGKLKNVRGICKASKFQKKKKKAKKKQDIFKELGIERVM